MLFLILPRIIYAVYLKEAIDEIFAQNLTLARERETETESLPDFLNEIF